MIFNVNLRNAVLTDGGGQVNQTGAGTSQDSPAKFHTDERMTSRLNTPVFMPLEIKGGSYTDDKGKTVSFEGMFLDTVLMTVSQNKIIEETQITGRNGSVKEYIAEGDFDINIKVTLASPEIGVFPEQAAARLITLLRAPVPLRVVSRFLQLYQIDEIVITSISNPHRQGFQNVFSMDINASSHKPLELRLIEEKDETSNV